MRVKALPERAGFELSFPVVEGYVQRSPGHRIVCDVEAVEGLVLDPATEPEASFVRPEMGLDPSGPTSGGPFAEMVQDRKGYYETNHIEQIKFALAHQVVTRLTSASEGGEREEAKRALVSRHVLFPRVFAIVDAYVRTRVDFKDLHPCELGLSKYMTRLTDRLATAIRFLDAEGGSTLLPVIHRYKPTGTTAEVNFVTTKPTQLVSKSHLNRVVADTLTWEQSAAFHLDRPDSGVVCFAKNDRLGLLIPYEYDGVSHEYTPDFLCRREDGRSLVLEIKGHETDREMAKHEAAARWVDAVNNWGKMGKWAFHVCRDPALLREELAGLTKT